jgi:hypothetical protein
VGARPEFRLETAAAAIRRALAAEGGSPSWQRPRDPSRVASTRASQRGKRARRERGSRFRQLTLAGRRATVVREA